MQRIHLGVIQEESEAEEEVEVEEEGSTRKERPSFRRKGLLTRHSASFECVTEDAEEDDLPCGWHCIQEPEGSFYRNKLSGKCQLERPVNSAEFDMGSEDISEEMPSLSSTDGSGVDMYFVAKKRGFVHKQLFGGLFNRWRKKYFVLEGRILEYFNRAQDFQSGVPSAAKHRMILTSLTKLSYEDSKYCFKVVTGDVKWVLMTETKRDVEDWMRLLSKTIVQAKYDESVV